MNDQETKAFAEWLVGCGMRERTIKTYSSLLGIIRPFSLTNDMNLL